MIKSREETISRHDVGPSGIKVDWLLILFCTSLSFDFKGESGGNFYQLLMLLTTLFSGLAVRVRIDVLDRPKLDNGIFLFAALIVYLVVGALSAFLNNTPLDRYLRTSLPYLLFMWGFLVTRSAAKVHGDTIIWYLFAGCVLSMIFNFFYGAMVAGWNFDVARYTILSPLSIFTFGFLFFLFFLGRLPKLIFILLSSTSLFIVFLSATRSELVGLFGILIYVLIVSRSRLFVESFDGCRKIAPSLLFVILFFALMTAFFPQVYDYMLVRLFNSYDLLGYDVTSVTRLAEIENQYAQWSESLLSALIGKGIGSAFSYDSSYFYLLMNSGAFDPKFLYAMDDYQGGHNFWMYSIFSAGLLGGGALILCIVAQFLSVNYRLFFSRKMGFPLKEKSILPYVGAVGCMAFFLASIGGTPMGSRFSGFYYGILFSLIWVKYDQDKPVS